MRFSVKDKSAISSSKVLIIPMYKDKVKEALQYFIKCGYKRISGIEKEIEAHNFKGDEGVMIYLSALKQPAGRIVLYGMGDVKKIHLGKIKSAVATCCRSVAKLKHKDATIVLDTLFASKLLPEDIASAVSEGATLCQFMFNKYKKDTKQPDRVNQLTVIINTVLSQSQVKKSIERGKVIAEAINDIRDLGLEPANRMTPRIFADRMRSVAKKCEIQCDIFSKNKIAALKMDALLAVSQGSREEPRFLVLRAHNKAFKKHVCLVGKGVTFDSGGLSLKPSRGMMEMKYDMLGGATAAYITIAAKKLGIPVNITALIPLTENMPDGLAVKPGDVINTMSGLTIEVLNTDAEGRLILADALSYAQKLKPDYCIDFATLTGAMAIITGSKASGVMGSDQALVDALVQEGEHVYDRVWPLPLWDEFDDDIKSDIADVKNIAKDGEAGTIIAGKFLQKFIPGVKWAHIDIASTAWSHQEAGYNIKGPTGSGMRCVLSWLYSLK